MIAVRRTAAAASFAALSAALLPAGLPSTSPSVKTSAAASELRLEVEQALRLLPGYNVGEEGRPGNALNFVVVGGERELLSALTVAGWTRVPRSGLTCMTEGFCELAQGRWPSAFPPMHPYTLFGRVQDHNFSIESGFPYSRHHFRLWKSPFSDKTGKPIWWGSADFDVDIHWIDLSHVTDPDIDRERDFIASTLKGLAKQLRWIALPQVPLAGADDRGHAYRGDGKVLLATF
jgi:hypothetical protein